MAWHGTKIDAPARVRNARGARVVVAVDPRLDEAETPLQGDTVQIEPAQGTRYSGPLVILTGPNTMSTSEDFIVPLDFSGRALLIGEPTAGTTGNPVNVLLPGGAVLRVCSLWSTYPDGREFVSRGIEPDIVVRPTLAGLRADRDEVLEKALEVLGNWDTHRKEKRARSHS